VKELVPAGKLIFPQSDQEEEYVAKRLDPEIHSDFLGLSLGIGMRHRQGIFDWQAQLGMQAYVRNADTITIGVDAFFYGDPDGSTVQTAYCANSTLVTDEAGKWRRSTVDGLGRLIEADEPNSTTAQVTACPAQGDPIWATTYTNDALDDLSAAVQGGSRNRSFVYDSLKRLASSSNPESGTITYTYGSDGNVTTRKDARNITTTYTNDTLNRVTQKSYSDGTPTANYLYDVAGGFGGTFSNVVGRMTEAYTGSGNPLVSASVFGYDTLGRVLMNNQCDPSTCPAGTGYAMNYAYDLAGDMTSSSASAAQYTLTYAYDTAARVIGITSNLSDGNHPATLATVNSYFSNDQVQQIFYGVNGPTETDMLNARLQPCRYSLGSSTTLLKTCSDQVPSGNIQDLSYGFNFGSGDNGNVVAAAGVGSQAFNRSYSYDQVNRIWTMAGSGGSCTGLQWTYDQWGNRTAQSPTGGTCNSSSLGYSTNNQISSSGFVYDASGNMTHDASHSYFFDAESRIIQVDGTAGNCATATACYSYDALGRRVERTTGGVKTDYLYDLSGHPVTEFSSSCSMCWTVGYIYLNGGLVAQYSGGTTSFVHGDNLGSSRIVTSLTGGVTDCNAFYPYGEQDTTICSSTSLTTHKFEGKERDTETLNDNFGARYYSSSLGRWLSADWSAIPKPVPYANFTNPQTLNLYAMVRDNPETFADLDGHCPECVVEEEIEEGAEELAETPEGQRVLGEVESSASSVVETMEAGADTFNKALLGAAVVVTSLLPAGDNKPSNTQYVPPNANQTGASPQPNQPTNPSGPPTPPAPTTQDSSKRHTRDKHQGDHPSRTADKLRKRPSWNPKKKAGGPASPKPKSTTPPPPPPNPKIDDSTIGGSGS
jgi:RHS repeat-associated protein